MPDEEAKELAAAFERAADLMLDARGDMDSAMKLMRLSMCCAALRRNKENRTRASVILHIHRNTLRRWLPEERRIPPRSVGFQVSAKAG